MSRGFSLAIAALVLAARSLVPSFAEVQTLTVVANGEHELTVAKETTGRTKTGDHLKVLNVAEEWFWVQSADGTKGWIRKENVVKIADAADIYDALIESYPDVPEYYEKRALSRLARGPAAELQADYDNVLQLGSKNASIHTVRGVDPGSRMHSNQAIADYDHAIRLGLKEPFVYINRGMARHAAGDHDGAVQDFSAAIERGENDLSVYLNRAKAYSASGMEVEALGDLAKAVRLDPDNAAVYHEAGRAWRKLGNLDKAIMGFSEALRLNSKSVSAFNNRGYTRQFYGQYREALVDYEQALRLAPKNAVVLRHKAWLLATCPDDTIRNGEQSLAAATQVCELGEWKHWPDAKVLAAAHAESGSFDRAIHYQSKVVELAPEDEREQEQEFLAYYRAGRPLRFSVIANVDGE